LDVSKTAFAASVNSVCVGATPALASALRTTSLSPLGNACRVHAGSSFNAFFATKRHGRVWRCHSAARSSKSTADGHGPLAILRCRSIFAMGCQGSVANDERSPRTAASGVRY
jgi:hypothetical protein